MAQYAHLSSPDPELSAALTKLSLPPPLTDLLDRRKFAESHASKVSFPETRLRVQDWKVPVQGGDIQVRTYTAHHGDAQTNPLLVWAHGGGWVMGGLFTDDAMLQRLAVDLGLSIVNVDYRLAPEHPFPVGLNDTYEALKWAYHNCHQFDADPARGFFLGGCSAGGNFTAVLAHRARDDPKFQGKLTGQILQIPIVVHKEVIPEMYKNEIISHEQNKDAPILNHVTMQFFSEMYGCKTFADPNLSPILWPSHKDLPPAYFQICGLDPLRDEGFLYEKILREEGVKTRLNIYPGVPHAFASYLRTLKQCAKWDEDLRHGIKWLLSGGSA